MAKRVFLFVLDSFGIGAMPDAAAFGDAGTNTLAAIAAVKANSFPTLRRLGLFHIDGVEPNAAQQTSLASYARLAEASAGKDTTIGHWEIAGVESNTPLPTFPNGFPDELLAEFTAKTGCGVLCNKPYSGTEVLKAYGEEHLRTGALIVYTSADSVFQVAANEAVVPIAELYRDCEIARALLQGKWGVGRVIARPFEGGSAQTFKRTTRRHDYSLPPPAKTMLDYLQAAGLATIGVGKIYDIFAGQGISESIRTEGNDAGMQAAMQLVQRDFSGLAFINLVDFDMLYGHRNDVAGYANAMERFDTWLSEFLSQLRADDLVVITADHGCDPSYTQSTDHSREYVPLLLYGASILPGVNLGTQHSFSCVARTVCEYLGASAPLCGKSLLADIIAGEKQC